MAEYSAERMQAARRAGRGNLLSSYHARPQLLDVTPEDTPDTIKDLLKRSLPPLRQLGDLADGAAPGGGTQEDALERAIEAARREAREALTRYAGSIQTLQAYTVTPAVAGAVHTTSSQLITSPQIVRSLSILLDIDALDSAAINLYVTYGLDPPLDQETARNMPRIWPDRRSIGNDPRTPLYTTTPVINFPCEVLITDVPTMIHFTHTSTAAGVRTTSWYLAIQDLSNVPVRTITIPTPPPQLVKARALTTAQPPEPANSSTANPRGMRVSVFQGASRLASRVVAWQDLGAELKALWRSNQLSGKTDRTLEAIW